MIVLQCVHVYSIDISTGICTLVPMSRRTMQVHAKAQDFSSAGQDSDATTDVHSLPAWERVLMLALTYDPPENAENGPIPAKASSKKSSQRNQ
jgi:hypothetical protein